MSRRYDELDSLRGLASVSVMLDHLINVTQFVVSIGALGVLAQTPFHIFWGGHAAVLFFFVLSGFVLSLPLLYGTNISYRSFVLKRFIRIYVPYYVAIALAMVLQSVFSRHGIPQLGPWFNDIWVTPLSPSLLVSHLVLLGNFKNDAYDPVIWSLSYEMRISLIFPIIALMVRRRSWMFSLSVGLLLSMFAYGIKQYMYLHFAKYAFYIGSDTDTLHYILMFIVGVMLAKHKELLVATINSLRKLTKVCLLMLGVIFYTYSYWVPSNSLDFFRIWIFEDWCTMAGAGILMMLALSSKSISRVMLLKPIHFVGKMSYTLYLYHAIGILAIFNLLYGKAQTWEICTLIIMFAIGISTLGYYIVERPAVALTKRIKSSHTQRQVDVSL